MAELIVALDVPTEGDALAMAARLGGIAGWLKIGMELFTACGPQLVRRLSDEGFRIFLDLKFYDIPNTVAGAVRSAVALNVDMLTIHCQGGERMCRAAMGTAAQAARPPLVFGVTVLTSMASGEMPGISLAAEDFALNLACMAAGWGLNGVVCSAREARRIKLQKPGLLCLCPGIRPGGEAGDDQRRTMTPAAAIANGADYLVVGRPILKAPDPAQAARTILAEISQTA